MPRLCILSSYYLSLSLSPYFSGSSARRLELHPCPYAHFCGYHFFCQDEIPDRFFHHGYRVLRIPVRDHLFHRGCHAVLFPDAVLFRLHSDVRLFHHGCHEPDGSLCHCLDAVVFHFSPDVPVFPLRWYVLLSEPVFLCVPFSLSEPVSLCVRFSLSEPVFLCVRFSLPGQFSPDAYLPEPLSLYAPVFPLHLLHVPDGSLLRVHFPVRHLVPGLLPDAYFPAVCCYF